MHEILIDVLIFLVASQCFQAKKLQLSQTDLNTISTKIVIQMNAKMGGEPWSVDIPIKVQLRALEEQVPLENYCHGNQGCKCDGTQRNGVPVLLKSLSISHMAIH